MPGKLIFLTENKWPGDSRANLLVMKSFWNKTELKEEVTLVSETTQVLT